MATDNLKQLGYKLKRTFNETDFTTRRIAKLFPVIEKSRDLIGISSISNYKLEFKTYSKSNTASLNITVFESFDENITNPQYAQIPMTISQTGVSIGFAGNVGAENFWYPLAYLGDLNFQAGNYSVVINYTKSGSGTYSFKLANDIGDTVITPTIGASTITIPIEKNSISYPGQIMYNSYIYGLVTGQPVGGWVYFNAFAVYIIRYPGATPMPYTPREILP